MNQGDYISLVPMLSYKRRNAICKTKSPQKHSKVIYRTKVQTASRSNFDFWQIIAKKNCCISVGHIYKGKKPKIFDKFFKNPTCHYHTCQIVSLSFSSFTFCLLFDDVCDGKRTFSLSLDCL